MPSIRGNRAATLGSLVAVLVILCSGVGFAIDRAPAGAVVPGGNGKIVFESTRNGNSEIHVMDPDGSNVANLTNHPAEDITPSWSPDGTRIAWATNRNGGNNYDIYMMNADGSGVVNLTGPRTKNVSDRWPSFSPDGTKLVFMSAMNGGGNFEIYTMNLNGTDLKQLTFTQNIEDCCSDWSPDGSRIVFSTRRDNNFEIYTMNADGSNQRNLTNNAASYDGTPRWAADGRIAFRSTRSGNDIWMMNADGSNLKRITANLGGVRRPAPSPDGKKIAFSLGTPGNSQIAVVNADGTGLVKLTSAPGEHNGPQWQPLDGGSTPPPPPPPPPGGDDTVAPNATVATPTSGQTVGRPVTFSGQASDNVGVSGVTVSIQNRKTGQWWRPGGGWGPWTGHAATLGSPGGASTSWSFTWQPPPGPGDYGLALIARDTSGNTQPRPRPWVTFRVS